MPIFGPFPRVDLPKNNLQSLLLRISLDLDLDRMEADVGRTLSTTLWAQETLYSRRKQRHSIFEVIRRNIGDDTEYTYLVFYRLTDENRSQIPNQQPRVEVNTYLNGVSNATADAVFAFDLDSQLGRRFLRAFPFFADANDLYSLPPKNPPLTTIWEIRGVKIGPNDSFEHYLSVESTSGPFEVQVGIILQGEETPEQWVDSALVRSTSIVAQMGG